jgi:exodeoxyribonuclease-3
MAAMPACGSTTCCSARLADRLVDAQVDMHVRGWEKTSDHAPVWVELADKPKRKRRP